MWFVKSLLSMPDVVVNIVPWALRRIFFYTLFRHRKVVIWNKNKIAIFMNKISLFLSHPPLRHLHCISMVLQSRQNMKKSMYLEAYFRTKFYFYFVLCSNILAYSLLPILLSEQIVRK
jgi:hypothetical protein